MTKIYRGGRLTVMESVGPNERREVRVTKLDPNQLWHDPLEVGEDVRVRGTRNESARTDDRLRRSLRRPSDAAAGAARTAQLGKPSVLARPCQFEGAATNGSAGGASPHIGTRPCRAGGVSPHIGPRHRRARTRRDRSRFLGFLAGSRRVLVRCSRLWRLR